MYKKGYLEGILGRSLPGKQICLECGKSVSTLFAKSDLKLLKVIYVCYECNNHRLSKRSFNN